MYCWRSLPMVSNADVPLTKNKEVKMKLFKNAAWLALAGIGCLALSYAAENDKGEIRVLCSNGMEFLTS